MTHTHDDKYSHQHRELHTKESPRTTAIAETVADSGYGPHAEPVKQIGKENAHTQAYHAAMAEAQYHGRCHERIGQDLLEEEHQGLTLG